MNIKRNLGASARQRARLHHKGRKIGREKVSFASWVFLCDRPCVFLRKRGDVVSVLRLMRFLCCEFLILCCDDGVENDFLFWNWGHVHVYVLKHRVNLSHTYEMRNMKAHEMCMKLIVFCQDKKKKLYSNVGWMGFSELQSSRPDCNLEGRFHTWLVWSVCHNLVPFPILVWLI